MMSIFLMMITRSNDKCVNQGEGVSPSCRTVCHQKGKGSAQYSPKISLGCLHLFKKISSGYLNLFDNLTFIPQIGATPFQNKTYWFNWQSNEQVALILCLIDIFFWESLGKSGHMLGIFSKVTGKIWRCTGYMLQRNDFSKS